MTSNDLQMDGSQWATYIHTTDTVIKSTSQNLRKTKDLQKMLYRERDFWVETCTEHIILTSNRPTYFASQKCTKYADVIQSQKQRCLNLSKRRRGLCVDWELRFKPSQNNEILRCQAFGIPLEYDAFFGQFVLHQDTPKQNKWMDGGWMIDGWVPLPSR
jgi:hypothetical protein